MGAAEVVFRRAHLSAVKGRPTALYSRPSCPPFVSRFFPSLDPSLLPTSEFWNGSQIDTGDEREVMDGPR
jgi:hypothetical protein